MLAVLGIDPGSRWTAGVLRVGDEAVYGWTVGPGSPDEAKALDDPDDVAAVGRFIQRILTRVDETAALVEQRGYERFRLAVETVRVPIGWRNGRRTSISLVDWLVPRQIVAGLLAADPATRLVLPDRHGRAELDSYPVELRRRRPPGWGPNDSAKGERDHERAAYDIAGVAARLP